MKELFVSFIENFKDRIKNPFLGAFLLGFVSFNWKAIFTLLFSNKIIEERIIFLESNYSDIQHLLFYPFLFALVYSIILPYLLALVEWVSKYSASLRRKIFNSIKLSEIKAFKDIALEEIDLEEIKANHREKRPKQSGSGIN